MESDLEDLKDELEYGGSIPLKNKSNGSTAKLIGMSNDNSKFYITEKGNYKEISLEEFLKDYDESNTLSNLKEEFKDGQCNLCPHEPLAALCMIVDTPDYNRDYEVVFATPISWLLSKLNEREGKEYWDQEKLFNWLNEEYTSEDSEWIWEEACIDKKLVCYNIF